MTASFSPFTDPDLVNSTKITVTGIIQSELMIYLSDPVGILNRKFPNMGAWIVFNGNVLNSSLSFAYYGIKEGDNLILVKKFDKMEKQKNTKELLEEYDRNARIRFERSMNFKEAYKNECSRLSDLSFKRFISKPSSYRKILKAIRCKREQNDNSANHFKTNFQN